MVKARFEPSPIEKDLSLGIAGPTAIANQKLLTRGRKRITHRNHAQPEIHNFDRPTFAGESVTQFVLLVKGIDGRLRRLSVPGNIQLISLAPIPQVDAEFNHALKALGSKLCLATLF